MASTQTLSAATQDRKARLAQLKSLKRKHPDETVPDALERTSPLPKSPRRSESQEAEDKSNSSRYLSGRNYDVETRGAKLGFETAPSEGQATLEARAAALAEETQRQAAEEAKAEQPLDLFQLQPRKPNWDLKRDLERKLEVLNVRTDNAIARIVRERIAEQQQAARREQRNDEAQLGRPGVNGRLQAQDGDEEAAGIEGSTLVEATNVREREREEDLRREREEEAALLQDET